MHVRMKMISRIKWILLKMISTIFHLEVNVLLSDLVLFTVFACFVNRFCKLVELRHS